MIHVRWVLFEQASKRSNKKTKHNPHHKIQYLTQINVKEPTKNKFNEDEDEVLNLRKHTFLWVKIFFKNIEFRDSFNSSWGEIIITELWVCEWRSL